MVSTVLLAVILVVGSSPWLGVTAMPADGVDTRVDLERRDAGEGTQALRATNVEEDEFNGLEEDFEEEDDAAYLDEREEEEEEEDEEEEEEEEEEGLSTVYRKRRDTGQKIVEVVIYLDKGYIQKLADKKNVTTLEQTRDFMQERWKRVESGFVNSTHYGDDIKFQIKKIVFWTENPGFYKDLGGALYPKRLKYFCTKTPHSPSFDLKVLYTSYTDSRYKAFTYLKGMCRKLGKCFVLRTVGNQVSIEQHESGHIFGLNHERKMTNCTSEPGKGFMTFKTTNLFKDCYRPVLTNNLRPADGSKTCFDKVNVPDLTPDDPELKIFPTP